MTHTNRSQRIYSALVWLYPASFRSEYGECLEGAFEDLRREASGPAVMARFWVRTLWDLVRSVVTEHIKHIHRPTPKRDRKFRTQWITTMVAAGAVGPLVGSWVVYLMRPIEFALSVQIVSTWVFTGAFLGMMIGMAEAILLRSHGISPPQWVAASIVGGIAGWTTGMSVGRFVGSRFSILGPDVLALLVAFSITALALGGVQWWVLRRSHRQAQSWIAANVAAAPVACFAGLPFLSGALGLESMSASLIVNVVVMSTLGVMTASSIDRILGHPRQPEPTLPDADLQVASD